MGQLTFSTISRAAHWSPTSLLELFVADLVRQGFADVSLELAPVGSFGGLDPVLKAHGIFKRRLQDQEIPTEVSLVIGERADSWFLLSSVGVAREVSLSIWAINERALSLVCETLQTTIPLQAVRAS